MKVFVVLPLLNQVSSFEFFFPEFLKQFSIYDWVLPQKQQNEGILTPFEAKKSAEFRNLLFFKEIEPIFVDLDYNANSRLLFDVFEDERHELESIEEEYEDPSDSNIARQGHRDLNNTEINQRKKTENRFIELPNLVPQIKGQYRLVSFRKLDLLVCPKI